MKKAKPKVYFPGKLPKLWEHLVMLHSKNPAAFADPEMLRSTVAQSWHALKDKEHCPNCAAGMIQNVYTADLHTGLLLYKAAQEVQLAVKKGKPFTEANLVHVPTLVHSQGATEATTKNVAISQYLNFMHQPDSKKRTGFYVITTWGWKALAGEPVPKWVKVWRGEIVERSTETTTLKQMFQTHRDRVQKSVAMRRRIEADYTEDVRDYDPIEWRDFGGYQEGLL